MNNVRRCSWCKAPIEKGNSYISIDNGEEFCTYDCFDEFAWDYLKAEEKE